MDDPVAETTSLASEAHRVVANLDALRPSHQPPKRRPEAQPAKAAVDKGVKPPLEEVVAELGGKLAQAREHQAAIGRERKAISLAAHMGSADDRARLDHLNQEAAILAGEVEGIEAAI